MKLKSLFALLSLLVLTAACSKKDDGNPLDKLDPSAPATEKELREYDKFYEEETGMSAFIPGGVGTCYREQCPVYALVDRATQTLTLYINSAPVDEWKVSSGGAGHATPNFDKNPNGRIYDAYTSRKFPGGDFEGLGNMPYAVFIEGGYAIHGTSKGNWKKLGKPASHGCIRLHPDNAKIFNGLVRRYGVKRVWITVQ